MSVPRALGATLTRYGKISALLALFGVLPGGCVYDSSNRCGPHQVTYGDPARCVCDASSAYTATGCTVCGEHEVPGPTGCACVPGYAKASPNEACTEVPMGLGTACSASEPCPDPAFSVCATAADGSGYCTNECAAAEDCSGGYACDTTATPSYCERPPTGAGLSCSSDADCAGTESTYCDAFVSHGCLVQGCTLSPNDCFSGTECCDLSAFGVPQPICVAEGGCPK